MRSRILVGALLAVCAIGLGASPASANGGGGSKCNGTVNGGTISGDVSVGNNAVCILNGVNVTGNVILAKNAYFESNGSTIAGSVTSFRSLTIYIWNHSKVGGNVVGLWTPQVFVYNSTVRNVAAVDGVAPGYGHFQVCGSTVSGTVGAALMGPDVLIGDAAAGCGANTVGGSIVAAGNTTDQELYVIGNTVSNGDIGIYYNTGVGDKQVHGNNAAQGDLVCSGNSAPFSGTANGTVGDLEGSQCAAATITGVDAGS